VSTAGTDVAPPAVVLAGRGLTIDDVSRVAHSAAPVRLDPAALERAGAAHAVILDLVARDVPLYGVTTGSGANRGVRIAPEEIAAFQMHLVTSHCVGVGPPLPTPVVRALLLIRAHGIAGGGTGAHPAIAALIVALLNARIHPIVPAWGSVGMSDLAPMAHAALPLLGLGEVEVAGQRLPARRALEQAGLSPVTLGPKDGLTLTSSHAPALALGIQTAAEVRALLAAADAVAALTLEGFGANTSPLDARVLQARPFAGDVAVAARLRTMLAGSALWEPAATRVVQDPLSVRCIPQVHGATHDALAATHALLGAELVAAADNPLVVAADEAVLSNGNFHQGRLALTFDALALALYQQATLTANRIMRLMSPRFTPFPAYLTPRPGLNCGFATLQKTFVSLVAEVRHLANPGGLDALPVAEDVEDHAAMAMFSMRKIGAIVERLRYVLACEALTAAQAVDLLGGPARLGGGTRAVYDAVRAVAAVLEEDRVLSPDVERVRDLIASGTLGA